MSVQYKVLFERGRFFIETGTARGFNIFHAHAGGLVRCIPVFVLKNIERLITLNNIEAATAIWSYACESADRGEPKKLVKNTFILANMVMFVASLGILLYFLC